MKTAQEWQIALDLDELPDAELLALLGEAQDYETSLGTLPDHHFVRVTPDEIAQAVAVGSVGQAFRTIRERQGLTVRAAGERWGVSSGRISQLEHPDANLTIGTITEMLARMGQRARLVIEDNEQQVIEARLSR
ncbi:helix-turn-helix transcriptional regulator [Deinococcus sp.]|uniref:helix-turn-helix domain-containing protein n=1 Tax=Deinococcus sp. TaxID=47478 RepID=UPI0025DE69B1|nr:helix-turn-helix transcriptional regulator [Deinococcus sp.]